MTKTQKARIELNSIKSMKAEYAFMLLDKRLDPNQKHDDRNLSQYFERAGLTQHARACKLAIG